MAFDINNNYSGVLYGRDRLGYTTPDADASEPLRPFLPVPYPAPWLPGRRIDEGHPVGAQVVLSSHTLVGLDKSGALIPAGLVSGNTGAGLDHANGVGYVVIQYGQNDVGFAYNANTGLLVAAAGEYATLACPNDGANGDVVTLPNGNVITIQTGDVTLGKACTLVPGTGSGSGTAATARPIGYIVRNAFQFLGGVTVTSTTGSMSYTLNAVTPEKFKVLNYMHEMGTTIQTHFVLRMPWIGAIPGTLAALATADSISGYTQSDFGRSFVHFTASAGTPGVGNPHAAFSGLGVKASTLGNGTDSGNYTIWDPATDKADTLVGRVLGVESLYPIRDFANRVRTQFERALDAVGPWTTRTPQIGLMGGSATRGMDYMVALTTDGIFRFASDQGKSIKPEYMTYVYLSVHV